MTRAGRVSQTDQMLRRIRALALSWMACLPLYPTLFALAQVGAANVAGIVEDSTGARIPDASVKLINTLTGTENDCITGRDGAFFLAGILPGTYTLQIEHQGFATAQVTGLTINGGESKNLLIRLRIGRVSETVEIDASGITLNTADATVGTTVDRKFATNIPVNGRSFQDLITMTPGVLTQSPQAIASPLGANGGLSVNGQKTDGNYFLVDGVSGNFGAADLSGSRKIPSDGSQPALTAIGTTQSLASIDALEEFRVLSSSYSAEYGTAPGGQFELITRTGTDIARSKIHGSIFDYVRQDIFDSRDWLLKFFPSYETYPVSVAYHQNDLGATVGFPLNLQHEKDGRSRTFLFGSYEGIGVSQPSFSYLQYTPSAQGLEESPQPIQTLLYAFPLQAAPVTQTSLLVPFGPSDLPGLPSRGSASAIRFDHNFSRGISAFLRYNESRTYSTASALSSLTTIDVHSQMLTLGVAAPLSSIWNNDFRLGFATDSSSLSTDLDSYDSSAVLLLSGLGTSELKSRGQVFIHIPGLGESAIDVDQATSALRQWNLRDTLSVQTGSHFLRFGIDYRHIVSNVTPAPLSVEADFFDANSLLSNSASDISITRTEPATPVFNEFSAFAQDEWRLSKTLTLSPGLRWEVDPPPHGEHDADAYTLLGSAANPSTLQLAPRGTPLWHTSWLNLAPRLGAAWSLNDQPGCETVVRAGTGIYFGTDNQPAAEAFNGVGFSATNHLENMPVPITAAQLDFPVTPSAPYTNTLVFAFPRHFQLPYTFQWNLSVDQAIGKNQVANASWVGASGHRLLAEQRIDINNQNPEFGEVSYFPEGVTSSYQSFQLKFQRSISTGIQALASYVWSHTLDFGSTAPEFPLVHGNSDLDVRQNLQAVLSWQQHPHLGSWAIRHLFAGWAADGRLSARTGFPVNLMGNLFSDPATGDRYYSGVDLIPSRPLYLDSSQYPGGRAFNGGPDAVNPAFVLPIGPAAGNAPRNLVRDFGDFQINAAIARDLHFAQWMNLHLRAEAFNLFNHPSLGYIDPVVSNQLFGQATLLLNQSFGSAGPLYQPGGPRSIQFSVRIHF